MHGVSGELRLGPDEVEAASLAHDAPATVAADEKARAERLAARVHRHFVGRGLDALDAVATPNFDTEGDGVLGEDALEVLQLAPQLRIGRTG